MIKIINNNKTYDYEDKMIYDYGIQCGFEDNIVALKNNKLVDIMSSVDDGATIEFVNENSIYSQDTLMKTGILLLLLAFKIKFPEDQLVVEYTIGDYMYLEFENKSSLLLSKTIDSYFWYFPIFSGNISLYECNN